MVYTQMRVFQVIFVILYTHVRVLFHTDAITVEICISFDLRIF